MLADAYLKQLKDGIDWDAGYEAVRKDATEEPFDWLSQGRGGLASWNKLHYIPMEDFDPVGFSPMTRTITRTVEYAYNDFAVAQMARGMNKTGDAERFERSAGNWKNLFRYDQKSFINGTDTGFVGFFQPRYLNGTWGYQVWTTLHCVQLVLMDLDRTLSPAPISILTTRPVLSIITQKKHSRAASGNINCTSPFSPSLIHGHRRRTCNIN